MGKSAFIKKNRSLLTSKLSLELTKKLIKCYTLSLCFALNSSYHIVLYGAETRTLRKTEKPKSFEVWCLRRYQGINEEVSRKVNE